MNDDDFERKLHALAGALQRPDPTPVWKSDILARARREADVIPVKRMLPPRWLMLGWAAAWVTILTMNFTTPRNTAPGVARSVADLPSKQPAGHMAPAESDLPTLLAFRQRMNLNLDLP